jgi:hypothetical protein
MPRRRDGDEGRLDDEAAPLGDDVRSRRRGSRTARPGGEIAA